jgi:hypothetical protein
VRYGSNHWTSLMQKAKKYGYPSNAMQNSYETSPPFMYTVLTKDMRQTGTSGSFDRHVSRNLYDRPVWRLKNFLVVWFLDSLVKIRLKVQLLQMSPYILSESTHSPDCVSRGFFANEPLYFIKINPQSIEHGLWPFHKWTIRF